MSPPQASDPSDPLAARPFSYVRRKDGTIVVRYHDAPITLLRGRAAERFSGRLEGLDEAGAQQLMARVTGNFKHGNERDGKRRRA